MKKIIITLLILIQICGLVSGQQTELKFFKGLEEKIDNTNATDKPLNEQVLYVADKLRNESDMAIIGHSQGGLRAIGYAGYLNRNNQADKLKAVVSIGGPVRGHSTLYKGASVIKRQVDKAASTLAAGWNSIEAMPVGPDMGKMDENNGLQGLYKMFGVKSSSPYATIFNDISDRDKSIHDMHPDSDFMKTYTGTTAKTTVIWKKIRLLFGHTIRIPIIKRTVEQNLPANVRYGFVIGKNSDVLELALDQFGTVCNGWLTPKNAKNIYKLGLGVAECYWEIKEARHAVSRDFYKPGGWYKFWANKRKYESHRRQAIKSRNYKVKADKAHSWVADYENEFAKLLGTKVNGHDCLVPSADQYIDVKKEFGGEYINIRDKGYYDGNDEYFHHYEEKYHPDIWGVDTDPGDGKKPGIDSGLIGRGGILETWFRVVTDKRSGEIVK